MKVFTPLMTFYRGVLAAISAFFVNEYEKADHELSALEEDFLREFVPVAAGKKK